MSLDTSCCHFGNRVVYLDSICVNDGMGDVDVIGVTRPFVLVVFDEFGSLGFDVL